MADRMLRPAQVAELLDVHVETLARWRRKGIGPSAIKAGPRLWRYPVEGLEAYRRQGARGAK